MGKPGKLFKSLVTGVRVFKSPSKDRPVKDDKDYAKKKSKDKCFGSLGKSSSRNRDVVAAAASSPEAIEIKCVQVESEKLKDVLPVPVAESFATEPRGEIKVPAKSQERATNGNSFIQLSQTGPREYTMVSDREEWAASKIQAAFRCYLAQRAFRALRALVRLQALARGRIVRRQASASLRCVNALIRVQALARGRRVRNSELGQLVQKHLQQTKQSRKKPAEGGWVNSMATAQQLHAKAQIKQDAVTKRQRALVYAFSEQLNRPTPKQSSSTGLDSQIDKSYWVWIWLERWTVATPKGGSSAIPVENCGPVTKNIEKAKPNTNRVNHAESSKKERKKWGEQAGSISPLSQKSRVSEEHEEPSMVVKREEDMKVSQESERIGTPKGTVAVLKPMSSPPTLGTSPPTLSTPPLSPLKAGHALEAREISLHEVQPSASDTSSSSSIEADAATQSIVPHSDALPSAAFGSDHVAGAEITSSASSPDNNIVTLYPSAASQVSSLTTNTSTSNGHPVWAANEISHMGSDSPSKESKSNSLSALSFSPQEGCSSSESLSFAHASNELNNLGFSVTQASSTPELAYDGLLSGAHESEDMMQVPNRDAGTQMRDEAIHSITEVQENHITEEDNINGDATGVSNEPEGFVIEEVDLKNDDSNQGDTLSETNGGCDASIVSVGARSTEVSSKNIAGSNVKHEQSECVSPSLPSYMATTKSAKAKVRMLTSPKPKLESPKPRLESPKPKVDSPKTKVDSPTQKVDSASKRRHSLSAVDGKVSPGTQKPAFHVRAGSKGNFSSMKDLSSDNVVLPNGDSRRHGK